VKFLERTGKSQRKKAKKAKKAKAASQVESYASPEEHTPQDLLYIPWSERWKLNLKYRNLPDGELETGHRDSAERITWLVQYPDLMNGELKGPSRVFFYSHVDYKGGPFTFLSNSYACSFTVPALHATHTFSSVEEVYQFCKLLYMRTATAKEIQFGRAKISTKDLCSYVLGEENPNLCTYIGRSAAYLEKVDQEWWESWTKYW
jgi:hypothetical protein